MEQTKSCIYCKQEKPFSEFGKHPTRFDGMDGRCKQCIRERIRLVKQIRETAPAMSSTCDCCGEEIGIDKSYKQIKLCLDHDPIKNTFRGWLCHKCNTGIGLLGDNVEGLLRALDYLKESKNA